MTRVGYLSFLSHQADMCIPDSLGNMRGLLDALRVAMQLFNLLENQRSLSFKAGAKRTTSAMADAFSCIPFPSKKVWTAT